MALTTEDMARISAALDETLPLDREARRCWLDSLRPEFRHLETILREALLGDTRKVADLFRTLPRIAATRVGEDRCGTQVGPWRIVRALGRGGMGTVWLAEHVESGAGAGAARRVALKLPKLLDAPGHRERLQRERDILASLEHPNIARLLDADVDQWQQPYLALEYIDGQTIDQYVAGHGLAIRERVALFLQVTEAVAYAHGRQVLHRDLKPANILVDGQGIVHLLDFGIAKLMSDDGSVGPTHLTRLAGAALTPDFASPEQLRGESITAASDVYSLGVVLYELLTGQRPFGGERDRNSVITASMGQREAPLASGMAGSEQGRTSLQGDLEAILARALRKEASERYPSVALLAEDLRRHLDGRRVMARGDAARRLAQRARHRLGDVPRPVWLALAPCVAGVLLLVYARIEGRRPPVAPTPAVADTRSDDSAQGESLAAPDRPGGNPMLALETAEQGVTRSPADPWALRRLGRALIATGQFDKATHVLQSALRLTAPAALQHSVRCELGEAYLLAGDTDASIASLLAADKHAPLTGWPAAVLATDYALKGDAARAARFREQAARPPAVAGWASFADLAHFSQYPEAYRSRIELLHAAWQKAGLP